MDEVTIHQAKTQFSRLMTRVEGGDEFVVKRGQLPVGRIVPLDEPAAVPTPRGISAGAFWALMQRLPRGDGDEGFAEAVLEARRLGNEPTRDPWGS